MFESIAAEFRFNFGKLKQFIPVFAIMFIPIMYAGTYLWAFWNPYGNTSQLQVAVVNGDLGAMNNGTMLNIGQQLETRLKTDTSFKWEFVSEAQAKTGLLDNKYVMEIRIPEDFSKNTVQAATTHGAEKPQLIAITNDRYNYIASLIGKNAAESVKEETAQNIAKQYATNLVGGITQLESGIHNAASGASQIASGSNQLGANAQTLNATSRQVSTGASSLSSGIAQAATGANQVAMGTNQMYQATKQLGDGLNQLGASGAQLQTGASTGLTGATNLSRGLSQAQTGAKQTATGAAQLSQGLQALATSNPTLANDPQYQALVQASQQVATGAQQVAVADGSLLTGATQLKQGQSQLETGLNQYVQGVKSVQDGNTALLAKEPAVVNGAQSVAAAVNRLNQGSSQLNSGAAQLNSGIQQFSNGVLKLQQGANHMNAQLSQASAKMPSIQKEPMVGATSNPVTLTRIHQGNVPNYGHGFAPYFMSLGMFVGSLLMSIVVNFKTPAKKPSSGVAWFFSKFALLLCVGVGQSLILDAIIIKGLGVHVPNVWQVVGFTLLTSIAFIAIIQFFVTLFGNPGRFLIIILLVLQLTSTAGTFPVELSPSFFQAVSPYVPMTYTVQGYRDLLFGGNAQFIHQDIWVLATFTVVFMVLCLLYFTVQFRREDFAEFDISSDVTPQAAQV